MIELVSSLSFFVLIGGISLSRPIIDFSHDSFKFIRILFISRDMCAVLPTYQHYGSEKNWDYVLPYYPSETALD